MSASSDDECPKTVKKPRVQRIARGEELQPPVYDFFDRSSANNSLSKIKSLTNSTAPMLNILNNLPKSTPQQENEGGKSDKNTNQTLNKTEPQQKVTIAPIARRSLTPPPPHIPAPSVNFVQSVELGYEELPDLGNIHYSSKPQDKFESELPDKTIVLKIENVMEPGSTANISPFKIKMFTNRPILEIMHQVSTKRKLPESDLGIAEHLTISFSL
jgi:hypothetical protein